MGKPLYNLLLASVVYIVCLTMCLADNSCPVAERSCSDWKDKEIMLCCLKNYKLGFDKLPKDVKRREDPPSCRLDLGLAECLSRSRCFASVTNALRILILNQLVFTKQVEICKESKFDHLLEEAEKGLQVRFTRPKDVIALKNVTEMADMPSDPCANAVYTECGRAFKESLQAIPGFDRFKLCRVFIAEGGCININKAKASFNCTESPVLNRFKQNSDYAGSFVLPVLCFPPPI